MTCWVRRALTATAAEGYEHDYARAIEALGRCAGTVEAGQERPGISAKLSSLCPRFEPNQSARAIPELTERLLRLGKAARAAGIALTIDAEEADRLELGLRVFEQLYRHPALHGWAGLGLAVQAYQKRALPLLQNLNRLANEQGRIIPLRLVKGAYWDMEIKRAQEQGLADYPVFTLKRNTDVSYLACARYLLAECPRIYPQFATHNAHTVSYIYHHGTGREYEFQRLYGMGDELYAAVTGAGGLGIPCRVYAPVGAHEDLLPYLVRRLLENGANVSFINRIADREVSLCELVADPVDAVERNNGITRHPRIPVAPDLFRPGRKNSRGFNFADQAELAPLFDGVSRARQCEWTASPAVNGKTLRGKSRTVYNPAAIREPVGRVWDATPGIAAQALAVSANAFTSWRRTSAEQRAGILEKAADLVEARLADLAALCVLEAGKCLRDAHDDVREAVDFLRYYAGCCRKLMGRRDGLARTCRRSQQPATVRARRVCLYQSMELSRCHLYRPGRGPRWRQGTRS